MLCSRSKNWFQAGVLSKGGHYCKGSLLSRKPLQKNSIRRLTDTAPRVGLRSSSVFPLPTDRLAKRCKMPLQLRTAVSAGSVGFNIVTTSSWNDLTTLIGRLASRASALPKTICRSPRELSHDGNRLQLQRVDWRASQSRRFRGSWGARRARAKGSTHFQLLEWHRVVDVTHFCGVQTHLRRQPPAAWATSAVNGGNAFEIR